MSSRRVSWRWPELNLEDTYHCPRCGRWGIPSDTVLIEHGKQIGLCTRCHNELLFDSRYVLKDHRFYRLDELPDEEETPQQCTGILCKLKRLVTRRG